MRQIGDYCLNAEVTGKRLCAANLLQKQFLFAEEHYSLLENFSYKRCAIEYVSNKRLSSYNICSCLADMQRVLPKVLYYVLKIKCYISVSLGLVKGMTVVWFRRRHPK